jgi:hypothetical protein
MNSTYFSLISIFMCTLVITSKFSHTQWKSIARYKLSVYIAIIAVSVLFVNYFVTLLTAYNILIAFIVILPALGIWSLYFFYQINKPYRISKRSNNKNI